MSQAESSAQGAQRGNVEANTTEAAQQQTQQPQQQQEDQPTPPSTQQPQPAPVAHQHPAYAPYPHHQQLMPIGGVPMTGPPGTRMLPPTTKIWVWTKLTFTGLCLLFAIITLSLSAALGTAINDAYGILFTLPVSDVAAAWCIAELITFFVRSRGKDKIQRGIHPGAHVGVHLILWLASLIMIFVTISLVVVTNSAAVSCAEERLREEDDDYYDDVRYSSSYNYYVGEDCDSPWQSWSLSTRALSAFWCLSLICHFTLFVLACIETRKRNILRTAPVVYVQYPGPHVQGGGAMPGSVPMGQYPPPQGVAPVMSPAQPQQPAPGTAAAAAGETQPAPTALNEKAPTSGYYA